MRSVACQSAVCLDDPAAAAAAQSVTGWIGVLCIQV